MLWRCHVHNVMDVTLLNLIGLFFSLSPIIMKLRRLKARIYTIIFCITSFFEKQVKIFNCRIVQIQKMNGSQWASMSRWPVEPSGESLPPQKCMLSKLDHGKLIQWGLSIFVQYEPTGQFHSPSKFNPPLTPIHYWDQN